MTYAENRIPLLIFSTFFADGNFCQLRDKILASFFLKFPQYFLIPIIFILITFTVLENYQNSIIRILARLTYILTDYILP